MPQVLFYVKNNIEVAHKHFKKEKKIAIHVRDKR
jgi:hypothetical protein